MEYTLDYEEESIIFTADNDEDCIFNVEKFIYLGCLETEPEDCTLYSLEDEIIRFVCNTFNWNRPEEEYFYNVRR